MQEASNSDFWRGLCDGGERKIVEVEGGDWEDVRRTVGRIAMIGLTVAYESQLWCNSINCWISWIQRCGQQIEDAALYYIIMP